MQGDVPTVSLFGYGAFGALAAAHLAPHCTLRVHDPRLGADAALPSSATVGSLDDVSTADWIVLATPVQSLPEVLWAIAPRVAPGAVVVDVASVKVRPTSWMLEALTEQTQILGTHPMFGPDTAAERGTVSGEPIVVCPVRVGDAEMERARGFLGGVLGLRVIEMTADEHDREAALVQGITHLIGRAAAEMGLPALETGTLAYRRLLQMKGNTERDSAELFDAIQTLNPHAADARRRFLDALRGIHDRLDGTDRG